MPTQMKKKAIILYVAPLAAALMLLSVFGYGCRSTETAGQGAIKLLYTSEVGGHLDPCG